MTESQKQRLVRLDIRRLGKLRIALRPAPAPKSAPKPKRAPKTRSGAPSAKC